jgi:hypothetical protein
MVYKDNFIAVIKHKGKIMREINGCVKFPFGSEYSILLKNKDSRAAVANIEIDGEDVMGGYRYIVPANSTRELKGFLKGMNAKNRFRFIKKTKEISKFRGDRLDDGLVRVEFWYEQRQEQPWIVYPHVFNINWDSAVDDSSGIGTRQFTYTSQTSGLTKYSSGSKVSSSMSLNVSKPLSDEGITVKGSKTNQQFQYGHVGNLETNSSVIVIKLIGEVRRVSEVVKVRKPITVRTKIQCPTCGRRWRSSMKFCGNCSTALS